MSGFFFEKGLVVLREGRHLEFQHRSDTHLYFEDPLTVDIVTITEAQFWSEFERQELRVEQSAVSTVAALTLPDVEDATPLPAVPENYERSHERKLAYVHGMRRRGITRGQLNLIEEAILEIAKEIDDAKPPKRLTVSEWMRKFERARCDIYVLLDKRASLQKRTSKDPEREALVEEAVQDFLDRGARNVSEAHSRYEAEVAKRNEERKAARLEPSEPISQRTFYRRIDAVGKYDLAVARMGRQEARRAFRMIKGHMRAEFPLQYAEIDHAQLRLWVIDDQLLLPLGRPWLTALRDRRSGIVLGIYITFRPPSLTSVFGAIRHSLRSKTNLAQLYPDFEHEWVAFGLADYYVSDRGREFLSERYRYAIHQLGVDYIYCESRTPWHKPFIERFFLSLYRDLLEQAPGQVFKGLGYHKDYNPKEDAVIRFSTLLYLIMKWAVDYQPYHQSRNRPASIELWMQGVAEVPPRLHANFEALNVLLGLRETGTLGHEGIRYKYLTYADEGLAALYREIGRQQLEFVVSEENLGRIHVNNPITRAWMPVSCTRPDYAEGLSLYQHQSIVRETRMQRESTKTVEQLKRVQFEIQERIAEELASKETAGKLKIARYRNIDSTAILAGRPRSLADALPSALTTNQSLATPAPVPALFMEEMFTDVPTFAWGIQ